MIAVALVLRRPAPGMTTTRTDLDSDQRDLAHDDGCRGLGAEDIDGAEAANDVLLLVAERGAC